MTFAGENASYTFAKATNIPCICITLIKSPTKRCETAIGSHEDLLTTVKRRKLKWYGHVTKSTWLAKTILQGTVQGGRRRGRQKKIWEDNIPDWTGLTLGAATRKAERREKWREQVARSPVAPQRFTRLRDR